MKKLFLFVIFLYVNIIIFAQNNTFVCLESNSDYEMQEYLYCPYSDDSNCTRIKELWKSNYYITSLSATEDGWLVVMSKSSKFSDQYYYVCNEFPESWIKTKWKEDFYITSIARNNNDRWIVAMTKVDGYTNQSYKIANHSDLLTWYKKKKKDNTYVTSAVSLGNEWLWVTTKGTDIIEQNLKYSKANTYKKNVQKIWNKNKCLQVVEFDLNTNYYFIFYGKRKHFSAQTWICDQGESLNNIIDENLLKGRKVIYAGLGHPEGFVPESTFLSILNAASSIIEMTSEVISGNDVSD